MTRDLLRQERRCAETSDWTVIAKKAVYEHCRKWYKTGDHMKKSWRELFKQNYRTVFRNIMIYYAVLVYWEILLFLQVHSSMSGLDIWNFLFLFPIAVLIASMTGWLSRYKKLNILIETIVLFVISIFYIAELIYFKSFGSLFSASMIGVGTDALANFWWNVSATLRENLSLIVMIELPVVIRLLTVLRNGLKHYDPVLHPVIFAAATAVWGLVVLALPLAGKADYTVYGAYHSRYIDTDTASVKLGALPNFLVELKGAVLGIESGSGLSTNETADYSDARPVETEEVKYNQYPGLDFEQLAKLSTDEKTTELCSYLSTVKPSAQNEYTGLFDGYNLIYICAESFSSMAIDETVTPTLYKMANSGIVLNNFYNSFRNTTTNGEYAFLTGLWPDVARQNTNKGVTSGTMGQSIEKDMSTALGNVFGASEKIQARAYHNYLGYYYGRNETLPNMGFTCKFMNEGMSFTTAWPSSDLEMMEQSVDDYIGDEQFMTYYMTFSGHGNYTTENLIVARNIEEVSALVDEDIPYNALGYLSANYELEKAMTYLLQRLEEAGKLDRTVIVLAGDHYPYYLSDESYEYLRGEPVDEDFESYRSTCIIYNAGLGKPIEVNTPCSNVDILPTVLNLMNIQYDSRLYAGMDIFSDGLHLAELYNKSFITKYLKYNFATGEAIWLEGSETLSDEYREKHLNEMLAEAKNRYALSIEIEETDFFRFLFEHYEVHHENPRASGVIQE